MHRSTLGIVIGYISVILYTIVTICVILLLVRNDELARENDSLAGMLLAVHVVTLIILLVMIVISGLLIMGIKKKRHTLMAPWVFLTIAGIIINILNLIFSGFKSNEGNAGGTIVFIVIQALIWYPIYTLYKDIRTENLNTAPQNHPENAIVTTNASLYPLNTNYVQEPQKE